MNQNGHHRKIRQVDPLRYMKIRTVRLPPDLMRAYRAAIERALQFSEQEHVGGHRHMREPLLWWEKVHHARIDQILSELLRRARTRVSVPQ